MPALGDPEQSLIASLGLFLRQVLEHASQPVRRQELGAPVLRREQHELQPSERDKQEQRPGPGDKVGARTPAPEPSGGEGEPDGPSGREDRAGKTDPVHPAGDGRDRVPGRQQQRRLRGGRRERGGQVVVPALDAKARRAPDDSHAQLERRPALRAVRPERALRPQSRNGKGRDRVDPVLSRNKAERGPKQGLGGAVVLGAFLLRPQRDRGLIDGGPGRGQGLRRVL